MQGVCSLNYNEHDNINTDTGRVKFSESIYEVTILHRIPRLCFAEFHEIMRNVHDVKVITHRCALHSSFLLFTQMPNASPNLSDVPTTHFAKKKSYKHE